MLEDLGEFAFGGLLPDICVVNLLFQGLLILLESVVNFSNVFGYHLVDLFIAGVQGVDELGFCDIDGLILLLLLGTGDHGN